MERTIYCELLDIIDDFQNENTRTREVDGEEYSIDDALESVFIKVGIPASKYAIDITNVFDSPGISIDAIAISWEENGYLDMILESLEIC